MGRLVVPPNIPQPISLAPWEDESFLGAFDYPCDYCYYLGDKVDKRVKWKAGLIVCKECFKDTSKTETNSPATPHC